MYKVRSTKLILAWVIAAMTNNYFIKNDKSEMNTVATGINWNFPRKTTIYGHPIAMHTLGGTNDSYSPSTFLPAVHPAKVPPRGKGTLTDLLECLPTLYYFRLPDDHLGMNGKNEKHAALMTVIR